MGKPGTEGIEEFLTRIEQEFSPEKVILFGSRAGDEHLENSDYDIIVVSRRFQGCHFLDRLAMLFDLWDCELGLDILAYTPEEFEEQRAELGVVGEAAEKGIEVQGTR